jgi:integrase
MANLKVVIVVRTTDEGKRNWVPATGKKDPAGSLYLRHYEGSTVRYTKTSDTYEEAEMAKMRLERKLKAKSQGFVVPEEPVVANARPWRTAMDVYISHLKGKTKRNGWKYDARSTASREKNILEFATLISKPYIENYTGADMIRYKEHLYRKGRANDTVLNKLACIVSWLKYLGIVGLLPAEERPTRRETESHPFSQAELDAMMAAAGAHKLLLRLALGTGMRKKELAHAERSDIDKLNKTIRVAEKPKYGWVPKNKRAVRIIPIGDALSKDLLARPEGLLFPNTHNCPDVHIDRVFEDIARKVGVKGPANDRNCWVHRWRDTYADESVPQNQTPRIRSQAT